MDCCVGGWLVGDAFDPCGPGPSPSAQLEWPLVVSEGVSGFDEWGVAEEGSPCLPRLRPLFFLFSGEGGGGKGLT